MKKLIAILLSLLLVLAFPVSVSAVTPPLDTPSISVPDISDDIRAELSDEFWDNYFEEHPLPNIDVPEETSEPTEPPAEVASQTYDWHDWLHNWYRWWSRTHH